MRVALRGCCRYVSRLTVSPQLISDFCGGLCCLLGCVCFVWFLFVWFFVSHVFEIAPVLPMFRIERPSELSWRVRHGEKKGCCLMTDKASPLVRPGAKKIVKSSFFPMPCAP